MTTLFRLQKYKKFESNSQPLPSSWIIKSCCFDCKSTKNLRAIHNRQLEIMTLPIVVSTAKVQKIWEQFTTLYCWYSTSLSLFRLQKYKKFESNSQLYSHDNSHLRCCFDCKSTKNLRAIHNIMKVQQVNHLLFRLQKYKKFESNSQLAWDFIRARLPLFRLQKYKKFESNSQHRQSADATGNGCFDCKRTKNLRAIHNTTR